MSAEVEEKNDETKLAVDVEGPALSGMLLLIFSALFLATEARPQATAQSGTAETGPGQEVVLSELPDMTAAEVAMGQYQ
jgi:hypothetical protein